MDEVTRKGIFGLVEQEPYARKLGMQLLELQPGYSLVEMVFEQSMQNIFGMAHGGAIFSLVDEAFETAANSHGTMAVALNMNITYTAAPAVGARLRAEAREVNLTARTACYEIKVTADDSTLIAVCQALVYRKKTPLPLQS